jgi:deoxyxylulose-5-phosphate synthase
VEWSGVGAQKVVIDWTTIGDADSAKGFGDRLLEAPRSFADRTSISGAIEFAMGQIDKAPYEAARRTIDVSGDGTNNAGRDVAMLRDEAVAKGITINGLVILSDNPMSWNPDHTNPPGGLANYYRNNVVGGPSAFVMVAENFNSFGQAIIKKMIAEVAQAHESRPLRAAAR